MDQPSTQYLQRDGAAFAYQVVDGDGPTVVVMLDMAAHLDLLWVDPHFYVCLERLSLFCRAIYIQPRGTGLSESVTHFPTVAQMADDALAVMDDVGVERAVVFAMSPICGAAALMAAREPERIEAMVFLHPTIQGSRSGPVEELIGWDADAVERIEAAMQHVVDNYGTGAMLRWWDPQVDTPYNRRIDGILERSAASRRFAGEWVKAWYRIDYRELLRHANVPTRVVVIPGSLVPAATQEHAVELLPQATLHKLPDRTPGMPMGEAWWPIIDHIEEVTTGRRTPAADQPFLATLLFTDVVGSTRLLEELGSVEYNRRIAAHVRAVRAAGELTGGRLVDTAGDGTFCVYDSPVEAIRSALAIRNAPDLELPIRIGVHTGEVRRSGRGLTGLSVHAASRICGAAQPGEVLVSQMVEQLIDGPEFFVTPRGAHELKGISGPWPLAAVEPAAPVTPAADAAPTVTVRAVLELSRRAPRLVRLTSALLQRRATRRTAPPKA